MNSHLEQLPTIIATYKADREYEIAFKIALDYTYKCYRLYIGSVDSALVLPHPITDYAAEFWNKRDMQDCIKRICGFASVHLPQGNWTYRFA
jgi:hypothetical protein